MMFTKFGVLGFLIIAAASFTGCCCTPMAGPCGSGGCGVLPNRLAGRVVNTVVNPCGDGCGEVYYGERINNPPVCDPCGDCGGCGTCGNCCRPLLSRLREYWGLPYVGACECAEPGCSSCDAGVGMASGVVSSGAHCASCAAGHSAGYSEYSVEPNHVESAPATGAPTPAVKPQSNVQPAVPVPHADPNASRSSPRRVRPVSATRPVTR